MTETPPEESPSAARDLTEEEVEEAARQGDPREPEGTPPEGRHPGAQDWPQGKPSD
ncbi:MAG TPA: hypothetical protein VHB30_14265 [Solirubrobacteraceae bacterium]|jgi:hypothetical protein|nr:hypothetical protein [Solirubrobacteraceae bacterium]